MYEHVDELDGADRDDQVIFDDGIADGRVQKRDLALELDGVR